MTPKLLLSFVLLAAASAACSGAPSSGTDPSPVTASDSGAHDGSPVVADGGGPGPGMDGGSPGADDSPTTGEGGLPPAEAGSSGGGDGGNGGWWMPSSATPAHYHWQLSTKFVYPADVVAGQGPIVYDLDGENNDAATVAQLHALGPNVKVVCYVDVGTYENFRSDAAQFPASVLGASNGWPGEQWVDVRQQSILLPIMKNRFVQWCVNKGFDAIEPDNLDAWTNNPGFPITEAQNLSYDTAIAALAHSLGMSVGLKNLPGNAATLEPSFDWALDEQCTEFSECDGYTASFLAKGKAVWDVEYNTAPNCATASAAHMNAQKRDLNLVGPADTGYSYTTCVPDSQTAW